MSTSAGSRSRWRRPRPTLRYEDVLRNAHCAARALAHIWLAYIWEDKRIQAVGGYGGWGRPLYLNDGYSNNGSAAGFNGPAAALDDRHGCIPVSALLVLVLDKDSRYPTLTQLLLGLEAFSKPPFVRGKWGRGTRAGKDEGPKPKCEPDPEKNTV